MKKALLSLAVLLSAVTAWADNDGLVRYGANITVLPSTRYSDATPWTAVTLIANSGVDYGAWNAANPNYNMLVAVPGPDANGNEWYEEAYDTTGIVCLSDWDMETEYRWSVNTSPFRDNAGTRWCKSSEPADIYIRREFTTDKLLSGPVFLACGHDDAPAEYYLNGVKIFEVTGWEPFTGPDDENMDRSKIANGWNDDAAIQLTDEQKALIRLNGEKNLLAVHVHQNWGGAFADCGLYTKIEGGLEMGYVKPWTAKLLFNSWGGYGTGGKHDWEKLYEAGADDVYTIHFVSSCDEQWGEQVHFKTPITVSSDHDYTFKVKLEGTAAFDNVTIKLAENDNDDVEVLYRETSIDDAATALEFEDMLDFNGLESIQNLKIVFDFGGCQVDTADVKISGMSLYDETDEKELWIGSSYFNFFYTTEPAEVDVKDEEGNVIGTQIVHNYIKDPVVEGRVETLSWNKADFDDSMWSDVEMPIGSEGYMAELKSIWPGNINNIAYGGDGGDGYNTNLWVRRDFELDNINERLSYELNVCHDDTYETYVNGHLLQKNTGWTNGKNPVQVHIPARYLNVGRNVIATYIQQNWGGRFYDCGIMVTEVNYDECAGMLRDAIAAVDTTLTLTKAMKAELVKLVEDAKVELETNKDAAELRNYARELTAAAKKIQDMAGDAGVLLATIDVCKEVKDNGYLAETLNDVIAAADTCVNTTQTNALLDGLRNARRRNAMERHTEKYTGTALEDVKVWTAEDEFDVYYYDFVERSLGQYFIYNVGERAFLTGAYNWGTHLGLNYWGNAWRLVGHLKDGSLTEEGTFRLETFRANGVIGINDFLAYGSYSNLANECYVDCDVDDTWKLIPVEGKENVFNIARNDGAEEPLLIGWRGTREGEVNPLHMVCDTNCKDAANPSNQWMLITYDEMIAMTKAATPENPVDMTWALTNPNLDQRIDFISEVNENGMYWVSSGEGMLENGSVSNNTGVLGRNGNHWDFVFECWNDGGLQFDNEVYNIAPAFYEETVPAGWYEIKVQGYYRDGSYEHHIGKVAAGEEVAQRALLYAGLEGAEVTKPLASISEGINKVPGKGRLDAESGLRMPDDCYTAAEQYFMNGLYWNSITVEVEEGDELLRFGVSKEYLGTVEEGTHCDWVVFDNFRVKYYGQADEDPTKVKDIITNVPAGKTVIYNIMGQKLNAPTKGVNIINGRKVLVK